MNAVFNTFLDPLKQLDFKRIVAVVKIKLRLCIKISMEFFQVFPSNKWKFRENIWRINSIKKFFI